jgi:nicotinamide-nucleotide amidase
VRIDLFAIGNEILYGDIVDTNTPHIAQRLFEEGYTIGRHVCVGDDEDTIAAEICASIDGGASVVCTGGLGPTPDDLTREALAKVAGVPLVRSPELEERVAAAFRARSLPMPDSNYRQADIPQGARYIPQVLGSAPGIIVDLPTGRSIYALPGVPHEMTEMLERGVLPDLVRKRTSAQITAVKTYKVWGTTESAVASMLEGVDEIGRRYDPSTPVSISYLPSGNELRVRLVARGDSLEDSKRVLDPVAQEVKRRLGEAIFGEDSETLPQVLGRLLTERHLTLSAAESLTGGLVGARLTSAAGASKWFKGSAVTYQKEAKVELLGIDPGLLEAEGIVSARCAEEMARGAQKLFSADVGISCTGEAGPEPQEAEVGEVYMAVAFESTVRSLRIRLPGDRERIREYTATTLMDFARRAVMSR